MKGLRGVTAEPNFFGKSLIKNLKALRARVYENEAKDFFVKIQKTWNKNSGCRLKTTYG